MGRNQDSKFAGNYHLPVEVLHEGLPALLRHAPDDEVRGGNLIRVATAAGLGAALALEAPGREPLQAYVVYYLAPAEAELIAAMVSDAGAAPAAASGPQAKAVAALVTLASVPQLQASAGATATAPGGRSFVIVNKRVLDSKLLALMAIRGELMEIKKTETEVRGQKKAPYYTKDEASYVDYGVSAIEHLKPLKKAYLASRALSGHFNVAESMLKCMDRPMYKSLLMSFPMTELDKRKHLLDLAAEYQEAYPQYKSLSSAEINQQLLGLLAFLNWQDKKRFLTPADLAAASSDQTRLLKLLKKQRQRFRDMSSKESLIGAECVNFETL